MFPTPTQTDAIQTRNKDILVSAGAGSGKTTVLTRRLIERILNKEKVTDFLVVTFTKAAASDIKEKLYKALMDELVKEPDNKHLYQQMMLVSEADICTISAFCLSFVKENFEKLGISPKVRVIDGTESKMLLRTVANEIINKGYETEDKGFLMLVDNFSGDKSDDALIESMISLYSKLRVMLGREKMLLSCAEALRKDAELIESNGFFATDSGKKLQKRLESYYDELLDSANDMYSFAAANANDDCYLSPLDKIVESAERLRASVSKNYVNYCNSAVKPFDGITLSSKGCDADAREVVKKMKSDIVKTAEKLAKRYCRGDEKLIAESFVKTADIIVEINRFLNCLENEYNSAKNNLGVLDYPDFEYKTLELLETTDEKGNTVPSELCLRMQSKFKEILIDEYQDVNPMQDRIFSLLSGKNNRFMVGDVKQSIYRFRNAYPDIFLGYKEEFADLSEDKDNCRIFLRENFRCAQTIIDYVNYVFEQITKDTEYYREYDGEWLIHGSEKYEVERPVILAVADKVKGQAKESRRSEAEFIAREISRLVNTETADDGSKLRYSDFAVMMSAMKGRSIDYEKAFRKYGIPYINEKTESFFDNPLILLSISALKSVDDPTDDISLCSLMRSPIFNFSSQDLYRIRTSLKRSAFWDAVVKTAIPKAKRGIGRYSFKSRTGEKSLCVRCREFVKTLMNWRNQSIGTTCSDFLKEFFVSSGLMMIAASTSNRQSLLLLLDHAIKYETSQKKGISGFIDYLNELSSSGEEISDAVSTGNDDAVSFITIHKSKGLEFKVCFLANADKLFLGVKENDEITVLRREGIFFKLTDKSRFTSYNPICNVIAADKERDQAVGEELRKLYVALTRAKERLYITGCAPVGWQDKTYYQSTANSWLDMLLYVAQYGEKSFFTLRGITESEGDAGFLPPLQRKRITPTEEMLSILNYEYPFSSSVGTAAKISVSELREGLLEDDEYNRSMLSVPVSRVSLRPKFAEEDFISASDIGTANHLFMQFCDFKNVETEGVAFECERLAEIKMLSEKQKEMLDIKTLEAFFKSELYQRIKVSNAVYREKRFSVRDVIKENGEPILVQGVIDCFFKNPDDTFTVVDYKTDRVNTEEELKDRHRLQVDCYRRAVERMIGKKVSKTVLWSFSLGKEVVVDEA